MALIITFSLLLLCVGIALSAPMFPNYNYLGQGVNILYLNPLDGAAFQSHRQPVLGFNNTKKHTTPDGKWLVPSGVFVQVYDECSYDGREQFISSAYYYKKEISFGFSGVLSFFGLFSGGLSLSMHKTTIEAGYYSGYYYDTYAACHAYNLELYDTSRHFNKQFLNALHTLPNYFNSTEPNVVQTFNTFIEQYGTHVSRGVVMGGRISQRMLTTVAQTATLVSKGIDASKEAQATFEKAVTGKVSGSGGSGSIQYREFQQYSSRDQLVAFGGDLTYITQFPKWAGTVSNNPLPLSYTLESMDQAIAAKYFPKNKHAKARQQAMLQALEHYIETEGFLPGIQPSFVTCRSNTDGKKRNECTAMCNDGWFAIGGGGYSPDNTVHKWRQSASMPYMKNGNPVGWRYVMGEDFGSKQYNKLVVAYAICVTSANATLGPGSVMVDVKVPTCTATLEKEAATCNTGACPSGYTLVGGGCASTNLNTDWPWSIRSNSPKNNGWHCYAGEDIGSQHYYGIVNGYAMCAKWTSTLKYAKYPKQTKIVQATSSTVGKEETKVYASCPTGYRLTGGGCSTSETDGHKSWVIRDSYPLNSNNGKDSPTSGNNAKVAWQCVYAEDYGSKHYNHAGTAYAICVEL